jgi:hypothetical protein
MDTEELILNSNLLAQIRDILECRGLSNGDVEIALAEIEEALEMAINPILVRAETAEALNKRLAKQYSEVLEVARIKGVNIYG